MKLIELLKAIVPCQGKCEDCKYNGVDETVYDCDIQRMADKLAEKGVVVIEKDTK